MSAGNGRLPDDDFLARISRFFRRTSEFLLDIRAAGQDARAQAKARELGTTVPDGPEPLSAEIERTSQVLRRIVRDAPVSYVTVDWLVANFGGRGVGLLVLFLGLFNLIPFASALGGLVLCFPAVSMMLGLSRVHIPFVGSRQIKTSYVQMALVQALPHVERFEKYIRPRYLFLSKPPFTNLHGILILVMAVILILPVAGANLLPAIAVAVIAIGYLERDGLAILIGWAIGLVFIAIGIFALFLANSAWDWMFG